MGTVNNGNQKITLSYKYPFKTADMNFILREGIQPGIYKGGELTKVDNTTVQVAPFVAYINVGADKMVRVETSVAYNVTVSSSSNLIYLTYSWIEAVANYADFNTRLDSTSPVTNEVVLGHAVYDSGVLQAVSYNSTTRGENYRLEQIENKIGISNASIDDWGDYVTYDQFDSVMYLGDQYVSKAGSNTGNNPIDNPDLWWPCPTWDEIKIWNAEGETRDSGVAPMHDPRDVNYLSWWKGGIYHVGKHSGSGGTGRSFQAYHFHKDGTVVTGNATLEAIFKPGLAGEYKYIDKMAPDSAGTRTIVDARGAYRRWIDATGGNAAAMGVRQEDQMQGHWHVRAVHNAAGGLASSMYYPAHISSGWNTTGDSDNIKVVNEAMSDSVNGTPRTGAETRGINVSDGVPYFTILVEL